MKSEEQIKNELLNMVHSEDYQDYGMYRISDAFYHEYVNDLISFLDLVYDEKTDKIIDK